MINHLSSSDKSVISNASSSSDYSSIRKQSESLTCSACKTKGCMSYHSTYARYFFNCADDIKASRHILIDVYYCESCGSYHALMPADVCPFTPFSYPFILQILSFYESCSNKTRTADEFGISVWVLNTLLKKIACEENHLLLCSFIQRTTSDRSSVKAGRKTAASLKDSLDRMILFLFEYLVEMNFSWLCQPYSRMRRHFRSAHPYTFTPYRG